MQEAIALDILISNRGDEPIYAQIVRQIKDGILAGDLAEDEALPSIRSLANELSISAITTKRAYEELEREGYIVTQAGRGSFVAAQNADLLREKRLKIVEEKLAEAVAAARLIGMPRGELLELIDLLYEEGDHA